MIENGRIAGVVDRARHNTPVLPARTTRMVSARSCAPYHAYGQARGRTRAHGAETLHLVREPAPPLRPDQAGEEVGRRLAVTAHAVGLPRLPVHDLCHTVVTDLLEAGEPEYVIQAVTRQLSKKSWRTTHTNG